MSSSILANTADAWITNLGTSSPGIRSTSLSFSSASSIVLSHHLQPPICSARLSLIYIMYNTAPHHLSYRSPISFFHPTIPDPHWYPRTHGPTQHLYLPVFAFQSI